MLPALIRKDAQLLGTYWRAALLCTVCGYLVSWLMVVVLTEYQDVKAQQFWPRVYLVLQSGSNFGYCITAFFAALLAGSIFTLERSDRSAEFLACLPPTRRQNLISKLIVALGTVLSMIGVHILAFAIASQLLPFLEGQGIQLIENALPSLFAVVTFLGVVVAMIGGALAVSAWTNSNGVPILCGLLTPLLIASLISTTDWALGIASDIENIRTRTTTSMFVLGLTLSVSGCYWYLNRSEP